MTATRVLCQVAGCGRPVPGVSLCGECRAELVDELRALATGGPHLERAHAHYLAGEVVSAVPPGDRPGLLAELDVTISRQHRLGGGGVPTAGGSEPPMLFHEAASRLASVARNTVSTWARDHAERHPNLTMPGTHAAAAGWLALFPALLAEHPAAGEMHRDIVSLVRRIRSVIDRPPQRRFLGQCSARITEDELCPVDVYAGPQDSVVQCPKCGAVHDVRDRQDRMLAVVDEQLATATEASRALSALDVECTAAMIRRYAHRGKLDPHPPHPLDLRKHPRYRIGDIRKLLAEVASEGGGSAA